MSNMKYPYKVMSFNELTNEQINKDNFNINNSLCGL